MKMNVNMESGKTTNMDYIESASVILCYVIGIGSIIYGLLFGNDYALTFVFIGVCALILVSIHLLRRNFRRIVNLKLG